MPSKSPKQRRFMAAAAHSSEFARQAGIPQSVAREFHSADNKEEPRQRLIRALRERTPRGRQQPHFAPKGKYQGVPPGVAN